jgi:hypothetical protein
MPLLALVVAVLSGTSRVHAGHAIGRQRRRMPRLTSGLSRSARATRRLGGGRDDRADASRRQPVTRYGVTIASQAP